MDLGGGWQWLLVEPWPDVPDAQAQVISETAMTPLDASSLCVGRSQAREGLYSLWFGIEFDEFHGACSSFNSLV